MRVETDLKLGFKDVLIRPKRSTLKSRSLVELERSYTFLHSKRQWSGVPIIAANMDTIGTFEVAEVLAGNRMLCAIHKHYSLEEWQAFVDRQDSDDIFERIMVSTGVADEDFDKLCKIINQHPQLLFICIDVANGYAESFVEFVSKVRQAFPDKTIIAGNVVTGEMVDRFYAGRGEREGSPRSQECYSLLPAWRCLFPGCCHQAGPETPARPDAGKRAGLASRDLLPGPTR